MNHSTTIPGVNDATILHAGIVAEARMTSRENGRGQLSSLTDPCSSAELAAVLHKSPKTIVDWCQERAYTHIPCFRLGNRWYHRVPELMRWLNGIKSGQVEFRRRPRASKGE